MLKPNTPFGYKFPTRRKIKDRKIKVNYFQRRPRKGWSFSLEYIFEDVRSRLKEKIDSKIFISRCYNDGYYTKLVNIIEAWMRQGEGVTHITGEVHFLNLLMNKNSVVLTILDCGMMERKTGVAKKIVKWLYLSAPVAKARLVTAISEETKKEIVEYTKCRPEKIKVIPVAVHPLYQQCPKEFNVLKPTILQIGTGYNKNLLRLIQALKDINCHLTIVGKLTEEQHQALILNNIEFTNEYNITNERVFEKYKECDILAFISTFEGFGMPVIEANCVERVVITSNTSSLPEVAGNAACLVDPYNIEAIRLGIIKLITDEGYRAELIKNGRENKLRFDANKIADAYYKIYSEIDDSNE
jgi:glycosyltransferase involved in cell wall biosynthesis